MVLRRTLHALRLLRHIGLFISILYIQVIVVLIKVLIIIEVIHTWRISSSTFMLTKNFLLFIFIGVLPVVHVLIEVLMKFCVHSM